MDIKETQKRVYDNKVNKNFNVTNVDMEFCLLYGEVGEAYEAYIKNKDDLDYELADIAIYLMGLAEILHIDLEKAIKEKISINEKRKYKVVDGINTRIEK